MKSESPSQKEGRISLLQRLSGIRPTRALPVLFLVLSLAIAGFGVWSAYSAQSSYRTTAEDVLQDYGNLAAWSFGHRLDETLGGFLVQSPFEPVLVPSQGTPPNLTYPGIERILHGTDHSALEAILNAPSQTPPPELCDCPSDVRGRFSFYFPIAGPTEGPAWDGSPPDEAARRLIREGVEHHVRTSWDETRPVNLLHVSTGLEGEVTVALRRIKVPPCMEGDPIYADTAVYGFEIDREMIRALSRYVLRGDPLLPESLVGTRGNREVVQVEILSPGGEVIFTSAPSQSLSFPAEEVIPVSLGRGVIRASVLPEMAESLVIGGVPESRVGLLLLTFFLAAALAAAAVIQLRRENRFARLREDFVAGVSHELRTPLAQVQLFTETLRLGRVSGPEQQDWALGNIERETKRLSHLVENILQYSRSERGRVPTALEPVDLTVELRKVVNDFRLIVPAGKAEFAFEVEDHLLAEAHSDSFRQIILNLLDNAVRYGEVGQTIRVHGKSTGGKIRIAVDDEGCGVPQGERQRIFDPFQRGRDAIGTVAVGSGIGLSVVKDLVDAHGGKVWVEDAPGGGARFMVELPALHTANEDQFSPSGRADGHVGAATVGDVA